MDLQILTQTILLIIIAPIALGVASNATWDWIKNNIIYQSNKYIPIMGQWQVEANYRHADGAIEIIDEQLEITHQFGKHFRGVINTPHPDNNTERILLHVNGEFLDKFHAIFFYRHNSGALTDMGAGVLQINPNHNEATGGSANFGVSSKWKTATSTFTIKR